MEEEVKNTAVYEEKKRKSLKDKTYTLKNVIFMTIIGFLTGAIITTCIFLACNKKSGRPDFRNDSSRVMMEDRSQDRRRTDDEKSSIIQRQDDKDNKKINSPFDIDKSSKQDEEQPSKTKTNTNKGI